MTYSDDGGEAEAWLVSRSRAEQSRAASRGGTEEYLLLRSDRSRIVRYTQEMEYHMLLPLLRVGPTPWISAVTIVQWRAGHATWGLAGLCRKNIFPFCYGSVFFFA
jgi:hypothetical protein